MIIMCAMMNRDVFRADDDDYEIVFEMSIDWPTDDDVFPAFGFFFFVVVSKWWWWSSFPSSFFRIVRLSRGVGVTSDVFPHHLPFLSTTKP